MAGDNDEWEEAGAPIPLIADARTLHGRNIEVTWRTGEHAVIDLSPIIESHRVFARLRDDDAYFATMLIDQRGACVYWPEGANVAISTDWLQEHTK